MLTWKDFKKAVESQGVKDGTRINFIDWGGDTPEVNVKFEFEEVKVKQAKETVMCCEIT